MSAYNEGLKAGTDKFVSLSIQAMKTLKKKGKPNVIKDFVKCLGLTRPGTSYAIWLNSASNTVLLCQ
jgi:hypothetical protein